MKKGDLLIQSDKIIGFLKQTKPDENLIVFHRIPALLTKQPDDLTSSTTVTITSSSSSTPFFSSRIFKRNPSPRKS